MNNKLRSTLVNGATPLVFMVISAIAIYYSGLSGTFIVQEMVTRLSRNLFLVFALIVPIMAGMGLNFGMVLGAMAGQIAIILVVDQAVVGLPGLLLAAIVSIPIAIALGIFCGWVLNKAKGSEMVTSLILGFFTNGLYQLLVLYGMGFIIPIASAELLLSRGWGIRNTVSLTEVRGTLDNLLTIQIGQITLPLGTFMVIAIFGLIIIWFRKTKLGQDMRTISQSMAIAESSGINVNRTRILAMIISTVLAAFGQIIYLQSIGNLNTYNGHDQAAMFAIAAILIGGASVSRATLTNAVIGVILLHILFIASPLAGKEIFGKPAIGEYFRTFVAYGIIAAALVMHAWRRKQNQNMLAEQTGRRPGHKAVEAQA